MHLLQVWYSSAWSSRTLFAFRVALSAVLLEVVNGTEDNKYCSNASRPSEVQALLQHWQVTEVSLAVSRSEWLDSQKRTHAWIGGFKRKVIKRGSFERAEVYVAWPLYGSSAIHA